MGKRRITNSSSHRFLQPVLTKLSHILYPLMGEGGVGEGDKAVTLADPVGVSELGLG